jgi:ubiquinone/menaquinone biosynthesis C-methylase UbiE
MNRTITNAVRFILDECLPPIIRDNKFFMWPLFFIWFKQKNIDQIMNLKSYVYNWTDEEFSAFYRNRDSLATDRETDLNTQCIEFIINSLDVDSKTLIDIGCGGGYFINKISLLNKYDVHGCDLLDHVDIKGGTYHKGNVELLPFETGAFDIVTCSHTLEHVRDLKKAISELKRIARKQLIIVVPCQKYYYYTLDEHINFFPIKSLLEKTISISDHICENIWGDWVYIGKISS